MQKLIFSMLTRNTFIDVFEKYVFYCLHEDIKTIFYLPFELEKFLLNSFGLFKIIPFYIFAHL